MVIKYKLLVPSPYQGLADDTLQKQRAQEVEIDPVKETQWLSMY